MTKSERTKQIQRRCFWVGWIIFGIICWIPFLTEVFAEDLTFPTAGVTTELITSMKSPIVTEEDVDIVTATETMMDISSDYIYSAKEFKRLGVVYYGGYKYTWYSDKVLAGGGLDIPSRHYDENGFICDVDGYICGASQMHSKGTVLDSPFGKKVKIYDWCDINSIDIYVGW